MTSTEIRQAVGRRLGEWDRSGWLRDGARTYPVGLGVLAVWALVAWLVDPSAITPPHPLLRTASVVAVVGLAALGHHLAARVLERRGALVEERRAAANRTLWGYAGLAVLLAVVLGRLDADPYAVVFGALAMTSPGVFLVVLDGSPPGRAAVRVLVAVLCIPAAVMVGFIVGFAVWFISWFIGSFVLGFLAGHLVTFMPLALLGPGPDRVGT